jgi:hypothetical protein
MKFEELDTIDSNELYKEKAMRLDDIESKKYIDYYNDERYKRYGYEGILPAEYSYEYHLIKKDWQRKVLVVDDVIIFMKYVSLFQHRYNRMDGLPISMSGDRDKEKHVFNKIIEYDLCKKVLCIEPESKLIADKFELDSKIMTYNYYSDVINNFTKIDRNGWRTKRGINRLLKDQLLTYKKLEQYDDSVEQISKAFTRWKSEVEGSRFLSKGLTNGINKHEYWNTDSSEYYLFEYDGFPVGLIVYILSPQKQGIVGHQIVNKGIDHMIFDNTPNIPDEIKKRIGAFMHYITIKDLYKRGIKHIFCGMVTGIRNPSLRTYKGIMNDTSFEAGIWKKQNNKI